MRTAEEFAKRELNQFRENHRKFDFSDLESAFSQAEKLGYLDPALFNTLETFEAWCELLRASSTYDASFGLGLVTRVLTRSLCGKEEWIAFPHYQSLWRSDAVKLSKNGDHFLLNGKIPGVAYAKNSKQILVPFEDHFYLTELSSVKNYISKDSLGVRTCPLFDLYFENAETRLVSINTSKKNEVLAKIFIGSAFVLLGLCEASIQEAIGYAKERSQGGRKILAWSEHRMGLAEGFAKAKAASLILSGCLKQFDRLSLEDAQIAFFHLQELSSELSSYGIQALGGSGYMKDYLQEKRFRDANQLRFWFGGSAFNKIHLFERTLTLE